MSGWARFCMSKADECTTMADEMDDQLTASEWRNMAADWMLAAYAHANENDPAQHGG